MWISPETNFNDIELDELFWFVGSRRNQENGINTYVSTIFSRYPRQILAFNVDKRVTSKNIQEMVYSLPQANNYHTDGGYVYQFVDFGMGFHNRNIHNKNDTHQIESSNADLRTYIPWLKRKSKAFSRCRKMLSIVIGIFVNAFNKFGEYKTKYPQKHRHTGLSVLDFL